MKLKMNKDAEQLKELARKFSNLDIGEIRMETEEGKQRYMVALKRLLCVFDFLRKDF